MTALESIFRHVQNSRHEDALAEMRAYRDSETTPAHEVALFKCIELDLESCVVAKRDWGTRFAAKVSKFALERKVRG